MNRPLKVMWTGLRGFPDVQGGVESHAEQLCPRLAASGCEVGVYTRRGYQPQGVGARWRGVDFCDLWAPRQRHLEALVHTALAVLHAGLVARPDVLHIQAIGPGLLVPLARLLGLRVVVTHHGADYERQKWGRLARFALRLGEAAAARWANELIVISRSIQGQVERLHGRQGVLIPNGLNLQQATPGEAALERFGLSAGRYVLLVSRLVPEKRHLDLIAAFRAFREAAPDWSLAIVGGADHADAYAHSVLEAARHTPGVVCTGFQRGEALGELYAHAGLFVLPSSHEGLPIAMLEALSYGVPVVASDIPAHLEVGLPPDCHFPLGDTAALAERMLAQLRAPASPARREARRRWAAGRFSWERGSSATLAVYERAAGRTAAPTPPR